MKRFSGQTFPKIWIKNTLKAVPPWVHRDHSVVKFFRFQLISKILCGFFMLLSIQIRYLFYSKLCVMCKQYLRELYLWIVFYVQYFIQNSYTIFCVNSIFVLHKVCPVPFRYNCILVLCPYRILFEKINICFALENITQCCHWSADQWKSKTLSSLFKCCFCQRWSNVNEHTLNKLWFSSKYPS